MSDTTTDAFLGGKITVKQPKHGYRAGVDAVLLAAATPAKQGQTVLELGCGVGVASLCLHARIPALSMTGVELQPDYADLAVMNAKINHAHMAIVQSDLRQLPATLRQLRFDHVIANPPYFDRARGTSARDTGRDTALGGDTPLRDWVDIAARRLAPKGFLTLIQHISRLPDILYALEGRLGAIIVRPIAPRANAAANLFLLQARHSGRAPFHLATPLILHQGATHTEDRDTYTAQAREILRNGAALPMSD